jgi:hypothetical protein
LAPGDLQVNGQNIGNTTIVNGQTYGSVRDFVNAAGGWIINDFDGNIEKKGYYMIIINGHAFVLNNNIENGTGKFSTIWGSKKSSDYIKVSIGGGYSQLLVNMQFMVDLAGGQVNTLGYDVCTAGGTYLSAINNFWATTVNKSVIVPTALANDIYRDALIPTTLGKINPNSGSLTQIGTDILSGLFEGVVRESYFESQLNKGEPFIIMTKQTIRFLWHTGSDSWTDTQSSNIFRISGTNVGVFYYGAYK